MLFLNREGVWGLFGWVPPPQGKILKKSYHELLMFQSLSPGLTLTNATEQYLKLNPDVAHLNTKDVVDSLIYILGTSPRVQV